MPRVLPAIPRVGPSAGGARASSMTAFPRPAPGPPTSSWIGRTLRLPLAFLVALSALAAPPGLEAQAELWVTAEQEVFHQTPDGRRLATVMRDTRLREVGREAGWVEVVLEGWIWSASVSGASRDGFDLVVSAAGGENLRTEPRGTIQARLLRGFLLEGVEDQGQWTRVRRTGWIREGAVQPVASEAGEGASAGAAGSVPATGERYAVEGAAVSLRLAPGGDELAAVSPGAEVTVLERRDGWVRVRVEGWAPAAELVPVDPEEVLGDVTAAAIRANPDQYEGRRVRWMVQFISLERAEAERTDFYEGEPFILARPPDRDAGFVYLAVPPELLEEVEGLRPLETVGVLAGVRTGRSALMGVPVLDLLALDR